MDIGSNAEILYNISSYNAYNVSAPAAECGRAVTIKCRDGLVPEARHFSKVLVTVPLYNRYTRALTFEKLFVTRLSAEHWGSEQVLGDNVSDDLQWQGILARIPKMCKENVCGERDAVLKSRACWVHALTQLPNGFRDC